MLITINAFLILRAVTSSGTRVINLSKAMECNESAPWLLFKSTDGSALPKSLPVLLLEPCSRAGLLPVSIAESE